MINNRNLCIRKAGEILGDNCNKTLNANVLKLMAILAMTVDHIADLMFPNFEAHPIGIIMHLIGRLTAPIMFFFICEGFFYTRNRRRYIRRLFLFAVISHFAYCFVFGINYIPFSKGEFFNQTSVMWTLAWSAVVLYVFYGKNNFKKWQKYLFLVLINVVTFSADWSCIAVMAIVGMHENRGNLKKQMSSLCLWTMIYAIVSFFFVDKIYGIIQIGVLLVYFPLSHYNGEKGKLNWMKWLFYAYYPLHLFVVGLVRILYLNGISIL